MVILRTWAEKKWYSISEDSLDQRKIGTLVSEDSPQGEWDKIAEKMILTFAEGEPRVHSPEECLRAKVVENCQYTIAPTRERFTLFFAQLFL